MIEELALLSGICFAGLVAGTMFGILIIGLCFSAAKADRKQEEPQK